MKKKRQEISASAQSLWIVYPWWQLSLIPLLVLPALTFLFYYPSLNYSFQFDDLANITKFFDIRHYHFSRLFFSTTRWISYWLNSVHYSWGKFNPFTYRLGNVIIHSLTGVLIYYFLMLALPRIKNQKFVSTHAFFIAFTAAALFLLHPVQSQTVSYVIQGQLEGTATLFILAMSVCLMLSEYARTQGLKIFFMALVFALGILACGTKEIAIMSPFLMMVVDWFFIARGEWASFKKRIGIHALLAVTVIGIYIYFLKFSFFSKAITLKMEARNNIGNVLTEKVTDKILPVHFFISQFKVIVHYLFMFVWPFNICVEYDWKLVKSFFSYDCFIPFFFLCSLAGGIYYLLKNNATSIIAFGFLWFFVAIAPRSSFIPSSELLTDYKTYLSSMGPMLLLALALVKLLSLALETPYMPALVQRYNNHLKSTVLLSFLCCVGYAAYVRNHVWRSGEEFWLNVIQNAPGKARAYNNYAVAMSEKGLYKESLPYYIKAIDMDNQYPDPLNNLAVAYSFLGDTDKAIECLQKSIKIQPHYPEAYNNLASFLINKQRYDEAEKALSLALHLRPHYGKAYFNWGKIWLSRNEQDKALECFRNACLKGDLDNADGFKIYAKVALSMKKGEEAIVACKKLLELERNADNLFLLASAYNINNNLQESKQVCLQVAQARPADFGIWYNLGELAIQMNQFQEAIGYFRKAYQINNAQPQAPFKIAYCHIQLQNRTEAQKQLREIVDAQQFNEQIKGLARNELAKLSQVST